MESINENVMNRISEANIGVQEYIFNYLETKYSQKAKERTQLATAKEHEKFDKYNSRSDFNEALLKKMQSLVPPTRSSLLSQDDKFFASYSAVDLDKEPINNLEIFKTRLAREWKLKEDVLNAKIKKLEEMLNGTLSGDALANAAKNEYKNSLDELIKGYSKTILDLKTQNAKYSEDNNKNAQTIEMLNKQIKNLDERIDVLIGEHANLKTNNLQKDELIKQNNIKIEKLQTIIKNEMQEKYDLQKANADLQTENIKNTFAKKVFDNLNMTIETQNRHINNNNNTITRLKAEYATLKNEFDKNKDELKNLTDGLAASTKELSERPDSSDAIKELEGQIRDLQSQISDAKRSSSELQDQLKSEIIISVGLNDTLEQTYKKATTEIQQAKQDNADLQKYIQTQAKTIEKATEKEKKINEIFENNKCYIDNSFKYLEWKNWNDVKIALQIKSNKLRKKLEIDDVDSLEDLVKNLKGIDRNSNETETGCLEHLIQISLKFLESQQKVQYTGDLEEYANVLKTEIEELKEEIKILTGDSSYEIEDLNKKILNLQTKYNIILNENQKNVLEVEKLETLNKSIKDALDNLKLKNAELEENHKNEIEQARIEYELALTKAVQNKENYMNELTQQNVELSKQLATLNSDLTIKNGSIAKLEGDIQNINLQNEIANKANLEIIKTLRENLQTLQQQLEQCKTDLEKYKSQKPIVAPQLNTIDRTNFDIRSHIKLNLSGGAPIPLHMKGGERTKQLISFDMNEEILVIFNKPGKQLLFQYPTPNNTNDDYVTYCTEGDVNKYNAKLAELKQEIERLNQAQPPSTQPPSLPNPPTGVVTQQIKDLKTQLQKLTYKIILSMTASAKLNKDHLSEKIANMANQSIVSLFKQANDDLKNVNESLKNEKDDLEKKNTALTADKATLEGENTKLEGEKTALKTENATLTKTNSDLTKTNSDLTKEKTDLTKENENLTNKANASTIVTGTSAVLANAKASLQKFMSKDNRVMFEETKSA
jgi:chromosome segregation ATPase